MNGLKHLIISSMSCKLVRRNYASNYMFYSIKRQLYSPANLKLDTLEESRNRLHSPGFKSSEFMEKMKKISLPDNTEVIFSSDLLKMLKIVDNEDDLNIFLNMLRKYTKQNATIQFSSYKFGPQVMRLFHLLKKPKEALCLAQEEDLSRLFSPVSSRIVLFDLLYENKMYNDIIRLYKQDISQNRASAIIILYFAACWKANTAESYKSALETHQFLQDLNQPLPSMAKNYLALLCLQHNNPAAAFELLENSFKTVNFNIKVRALAKAGRFKDLFLLLDKFISLEKGNHRNFITSDTVNYVSEEMEKAHVEGDDKTRWNDILQRLEENQVFEIKTLEEKIRDIMYNKSVFRRADTDRYFQRG